MKNNGIVDSIVVKCECHTCAIEFVRDEYEWKDKTVEKTFDVSVWRLADLCRPLSWRERIRWCWRILKTGNPWTDMIILTDENAKKIADFINKYV